MNKDKLKAQFGVCVGFFLFFGVLALAASFFVPKVGWSTKIIFMFVCGYLAAAVALVGDHPSGDIPPLIDGLDAWLWPITLIRLYRADKDLKASVSRHLNDLAEESDPPPTDIPYRYQSDVRRRARGDNGDVI